MSSYIEIKKELQRVVQPHRAFSKFCKTGQGQYAEHDQFLGVPVPDIRKLALKYKDLPIQEIQILIDSRHNEERQLALFILTRRYEKGSEQDRDFFHQYYLKNIKQINNWNLVDSSAHLIIGAHVMQQENSDILFTLARSPVLWERRIAMVATWWFIRKGSLDLSLMIAEVLLR